MKKINKVFLVDDSVSVNKRNESFLKSTGHFMDIQLFSNPDEVLNLLDNQSEDLNSTELPEIIFLDIETPEMDAFEFLEKYSKIKCVVASSFKPVIIILSDNLFVNRNFDVLKRYSNIGLRDQFTKPIDKQDVQVIIEDYMTN